MDNFSYKKLYLQLDEATVSFNGDPELVGTCISWLLGRAEQGGSIFISLFF